MIHRGEILDKICEKVGIRERAKPKSDYLNKRELMHLNSWIDITIEKLKKLEEEGE